MTTTTTTTTADAVIDAPAFAVVLPGVPDGDNQTTLFAAHLGALANAVETADTAKPQLIVDIVRATRDAPNRDEVIILHTGPDAFVTYSDVRASALGTGNTADATAFYDRVIGATPAGAAMLAECEAMEKEADALRAKAKIGGLLIVEADRMNALLGSPDAKGKRDAKKGLLGARRQSRNSVVQSLTRAFATACYIVENAHLNGYWAAFNTLALSGKALVYTGETGDKNADGSPQVAEMNVAVTRLAETFKADYTRWTTPAAPVTVDAPDAPADAGEVVETAPDAAGTPRANGNATAMEAAFASFAAKPGGRATLLGAALTVVANTADVGQLPDAERTAMLALWSALSHLLPESDRIAFEASEVGGNGVRPAGDAPAPDAPKVEDAPAPKAEPKLPRVRRAKPKAA